MSKEEIIELLKDQDVVGVIREHIDVSCWTRRVTDEYGYPTPHEEAVCNVFLFGNELYRN